MRNVCIVYCLRGITDYTRKEPCTNLGLYGYTPTVILGVRMVCSERISAKLHCVVYLTSLQCPVSYCNCIVKHALYYFGYMVRYVLLYLHGKICLMAVAW